MYIYSIYIYVHETSLAEHAIYIYIYVVKPLIEIIYIYVFQKSLFEVLMRPNYIYICVPKVTF